MDGGFQLIEALDIDTGHFYTLAGVCNEEVVAISSGESNITQILSTVTRTLSFKNAFHFLPYLYRPWP